MSTDRTHLEKIVCLLGLSYTKGAVAIGLSFFALSIAIMAFLEKSFAHITLYFLLSEIIAIQIAIICWSHERIIDLKSIFIDVIELPESQVQKWHKRQEMLIFDDKRMISSGIAVTLIAAALGLDHFGLASQTLASYIFVNVYYYVAHYIMGAALYSWMATALVVSNLEKMPLKINVLISKKIRLKGALYSKFTLCAACDYVLWGAFHLSTPLKLSTLPAILWFSSFAVLLCAYFILPQYRIHQLIEKTKKKKLKIFYFSLREKAEEALILPTKENASSLKIMLEVQCQIDEMCEWPFGSYEILHIALIIIIPIIVVLLEIMFGVVK